MPDDTRHHIGAPVRGSTLSYATADASADSQPDYGDDALEYLMDELEGFAKESPENEYEEGRRDALEDMLLDDYGVRAVAALVAAD